MIERYWLNSPVKMSVKHTSSAIVVFSAVIAVLTSLAATAHSAVFVVTKTADTNDGICNTDCSLREAILAANSTSTNDEIRFDPSTFGTPQTIVLTNGSLVINNNGGLWINGPGPDLLAISGNNATRVMIVDNIMARSVISSLTIRDGNGNNLGPGGGIVNAGTLALNNVVIRNNFGSSFGGGIYNSANLMISYSKIIVNNGDLYGGGICNFNSGAVLQVYESTISGNIVRRDGGGIYNNGAATIVGSTIDSNTASSLNDGGNGGGILTTGYVNPNSRVTVINSTIANNISLAGGGGILSDGSIVDLTNVTITGNTVTSPLVYYYGGGVINYQENYPGIVRAKNTIIADNTAANGQAPDFGGVLTSLGYNLIENTNWTIFTQPPQTDIFGLDPQLGPLSGNGGTTMSRMPLTGSPVIDMVISGSPGTDQRYYTRPRDGDGNGSVYGDIGAVEANSSTDISTYRISGQVMAISNRGAFPGQVQLTDNFGNTKNTLINPFGYFRFTDVLAGRTYTVTVFNKLTSFLPKIVFVSGDMDNLNFSPGT